MKIEISTDKERLNIDFIFDFLSHSYWAKNRSKTEVIESINHSLCFGMYLDEIQIGFARVVTDKVVFSYIMDVFIDPQYQGNKYGQMMMAYIYNHSSLINVNSHYLLTKDAQKFYTKFNFDIYPTPEKFMLRKK